MKELIAARELDTLVAEKVMGLDRPMGGYIHDGPLSLVPLPFYSTDIAAAWQVVEYLKHNGGGWEFTYSDLWYVNFYGVGVYGRAAEPTAPLAICKAALASVEK